MSTPSDQPTTFTLEPSLGQFIMNHLQEVEPAAYRKMKLLYDTLQSGAIGYIPPVDKHVQPEITCPKCHCTVQVDDLDQVEDVIIEHTSNDNRCLQERAIIKAVYEKAVQAVRDHPQYRDDPDMYEAIMTPSIPIYYNVKNIPHDLYELALYAREQTNGWWHLYSH